MGDVSAVVATAVAPRDADYEEHREAVTRMLAKRFPRFAEDERLELYHEAWAWALKKRERGEPIESMRAYLMQSAYYEAMRIVTDRRLPEPIDPEAMAAYVDDRDGPGERVLIDDQVRICREVIASLDERHRAVVKLRYDVQLAPPEICDTLGLSKRQYKRLLQESTDAVEERVLELHDGTWSRRQRSLLATCLHGMASDEQRAEAQRRLAADPHVAAVYRELRESIGKAAALLPLPAFVGADAEGRLAAALDGAREGIAGLAGGAKQQATSAYVRAVDTTPVAGARPGAVAAAVTGCIAFGGGTATYCAVEGIPDAIRAPLGIEQPKQDERAEAPPAPEPVSVAPPAVGDGEAETADAPAATTADPRPPAPVPAAPPDTADSGEFGAEQPSVSSTGSGATATYGGDSPRAAPAPAAPGSDLGFEE